MNVNNVKHTKSKLFHSLDIFNFFFLFCFRQVHGLFCSTGRLSGIPIIVDHSKMFSNSNSCQLLNELFLLTLQIFDEATRSFKNCHKFIEIKILEYFFVISLSIVFFSSSNLNSLFFLVQAMKYFHTDDRRKKYFLCSDLIWLSFSNRLTNSKISRVDGRKKTWNKAEQRVWGDWNIFRLIVCTRESIV